MIQKQKFYLIFILTISSSVITLFCLYKYGILIHFDEFTGRGLYPGLSFFNCIDLYEPKTGPHVTLYGWGMALFYSLSGFGGSPNTSIWIAFISNILSFCIIIFLILKSYFKEDSKGNRYFYFFITILILIFLSLFSINPTTESLYRIHADYPAIFFLLLGTLLLIYFFQSKKRLFLFFSAIFYTISFISKMPTLTCVLLPFIILFMFGHKKQSFYYILYLKISILSLIFLSSFFYGFDDMWFILVDHITTAPWSDRNKLFDGTKANLLHLNYIEAIPLLFRYFVMYFSEFWFLFIPSCFAFLISFTTSINFQKKIILRSFSLLYFFLLPPCLSAIAHFGGVENSLFFCNTVGFFILFVLFIELSFKITSFKNTFFFLILIYLLFVIPFVRLAKSINYDIESSPHQQAFRYLENGNDDVYFGWYPISHLQSQNKVVSCIEVPTWAGMTKPHEIDYSISHFPIGAKFLATSPTGYGTTALKQYLGPLEEVQTKESLSNWRLYKVKDHN